MSYVVSPVGRARKEALSPEKAMIVYINGASENNLRTAYGIKRQTKILGYNLYGPAKLFSTTQLINRQIEDLDISTSKGSLEKPIIIDLPSIFKKSHLIIRPLEKPGENIPQGFESVISFDDHSLPSLRFHTQGLNSENIFGVIQNSATLAALPEEIINLVRKKKRLLVISTDSRYKEKGFEAMVHSSFMQLSWNEGDCAVEATEIQIPVGDDSLNARKQAISDNKRILFFINKLDRK